MKSESAICPSAVLNDWQLAFRCLRQLHRRKINLLIRQLHHAEIAIDLRNKGANIREPPGRRVLIKLNHDPSPFWVFASALRLPWEEVTVGVAKGAGGLKGEFIDTG